MKPHLQFPLAAFFLLCSCGSTFAAWSIINPTEEENFANTAPILTSGKADASNTIVVKLIQGGFTEDSYQGDSDTEGDWTHTFDAHSGGWDIGTNWSTVLYKYADPLELKATQPFNVGQ